MGSIVKLAQISVLAFLPLAALASEHELPPLRPALKVEDRNVLRKVFSLLTTYQMMQSKDVLEFDTNSGIEDVNFLFVSGPGYIENQRIADKALDILPIEARETITRNATNTDICYVQNYVFAGRQKITLGVHNEDYDNPDHVFQCLTVSLWYYAFDSYEGLDPDNWRASFYRILIPDPLESMK